MSILNKSNTGIRRHLIEGLHEFSLVVKRHADSKALDPKRNDSWGYVENPNIMFNISIDVQIYLRLTTKELRDAGDCHGHECWVTMHYFYGETTLDDIKRFLLKCIKDVFDKRCIPNCKDFYDIVIRNYRFNEKDYVDTKEDWNRT